MTPPPAHDLVHLRLPVPVSSTQGCLALSLLPREDPPLRALTPSAPTPDGLLAQRLRRGIEEWAHRFAQAAVEIVGGDRPASQLVRWTTTEVHADLRRRALLVARAGGHQPGARRVQPTRPKVVSVHSCVVSDSIVECSVHVRHGQRSRAGALRRERTPHRWICTALDFS